VRGRRSEAWQQISLGVGDKRGIPSACGLAGGSLASFYFFAWSCLLPCLPVDGLRFSRDPGLAGELRDHLPFAFGRGFGFASFVSSSRGDDLHVSAITQLLATKYTTTANYLRYHRHLTTDPLTLTIGKRT